MDFHFGLPEFSDTKAAASLSGAPFISFYPAVTLHEKKRAGGHKGMKSLKTLSHNKQKHCIPHFRRLNRHDTKRRENIRRSELKLKANAASKILLST